MINEIEFFERYRPIQNPYTEEGSWNNTMFETYGDELAYVKSSEFSDKQIWTLIDCENEETYIIPGFHFVNRNGYFITQIPWEDDTIEVNCNEMITREQAIDAFINFWKEQGFVFDKNAVENHFIENEYSTGKAKYDGIELFEDLTSNEITGAQEDLIHNFYSNLV